MLSIFWSAIRNAGPGLEHTENRAGTGRGRIGEILERAGLVDVVDDSLTVSADYTGFDDFWVKLHLGVGPSGKALADLSRDEQAVVRSDAGAALSDGPFSLSASLVRLRIVPG